MWSLTRKDEKRWFARFGAYYAVLRTAHDLGDHVIQTDHQAGHKADDELRSWLPAMSGHVLSYTVTQLLGLWIVSLSGVRPRATPLVAAVALSSGSHAFIDRRWPVREALRRTGSPRFAEMQTPIFGMYVADQALHHVVLAACAAILAGGSR